MGLMWSCIFHSVQIQSAKRFSDIGIEVSLHDGVGVLVVCGI